MSITSVDVLTVNSILLPSPWAQGTGPARRVFQVGQTLAFTLSSGNYTASLSLTRAPAGNALTVSGLALSGAFVTPGRYAVTLTNAGMTRILDFVVVPATLPTNWDIGVLTAFFAEDQNWSPFVSDTTLDALTTTASLSALLAPRGARQYGATQ